METIFPVKLLELEITIAKASGVTIPELRSKSRDRTIVDARCSVWMIAHERLGYGYTYLSRLYKFDHTTIIHGVHRLQKDEVNAAIIRRGVKRAHPDLFSEDPVDPAKARTMRNWRFA